MIEKTVYVCEICGGSYASKQLGENCEAMGYPKHYNEFVGKWILMPLQIMESTDTLESSTLESKMIWFPVRIESNQISSQSNYDLLATLNFFKLSHTLKLASRSFLDHNIVKNFLEFAIIVDESYTETLNQLLVENEMNRSHHIGNHGVVEKVNNFMQKIIVEQNITLPNLENVERYEYKSSK